MKRVQLESSARREHLRRTEKVGTLSICFPQPIPAVTITLVGPSIRRRLRHVADLAGPSRHLALQRQVARVDPQECPSRVVLTLAITNVTPHHAASLPENTFCVTSPLTKAFGVSLPGDLRILDVTLDIVNLVMPCH